MAQAVHYFERVSTRTTATDTNFVEAVKVSAAELAGAGFVINEDVLVMVWGLVSGAGTIDCSTRVTYGDASITPATHLVFNVGVGIERHVPFMRIINLGGTIADIDVDFASSSTTDAYMERIEIKVISAAALGTQNTDWFYDEDNTLNADVNTSNTFTARAAVTFTPGSVEDWVIIGNNIVATGSTDRQTEARLRLDSTTTLAGTLSSEPEAATEELSFMYFHVIEDLSAAEHTIAIETAVENGGAEEHRASAILVFRRAEWADLYFHLNSTTAFLATTATQIATITDSVTVDQDALLLGMTIADITSGNTDFLWIREGGSTVIEPATDSTSGLTNINTYDATDDSLCFILTDNAVEDGAQDFDLFFYLGTGGNAVVPRLLLWGMNQPSVPTAPSNLNATVIDAESIGLTWTDNSSDEVTFRLETSATGSGGWSTVSAAIAANATSYTHTGLTPDTAYYYRLFAVNAVGDSAASNTDNDTTLPSISTQVGMMGVW